MATSVSIYLALLVFLGSPSPESVPSSADDEKAIAALLANLQAPEVGPVPTAEASPQTATPSEPAVETPETRNAATETTGPATRGANSPLSLAPENNEHLATPPGAPAVAPDSSERRTSTSNGSWLPWLGWLLSLLLVVYLIRAQTGWRTAFENKEWLLIPSDCAADMTNGLERLVHKTLDLSAGLRGNAQAHSKGVEAISQAIQHTRAEFAILREELDRKAREIADLKLGHEFHARRPVLRAVAHAMQIIEEGEHAGEPYESTIAGVATELRECLEDNRVIARFYEPGTRLSDARGVSTQESIKEPAANASLKGTIGETMRCAYVVIGPSGSEEIVRPARVRIYT